MQSTSDIDSYGTVASPVPQGPNRHFRDTSAPWGIPKRNRSCARPVRAHLRARGIKAVIPEKIDSAAARARKGSAGGRPPMFDAEVYKGRNVVERGFAHSKQWRGIATRYDKLAILYRGAAVLQAVTRWLRLLGDTP